MQGHAFPRLREILLAVGIFLLLASPLAFLMGMASSRFGSDLVNAAGYMFLSGIALAAAGSFSFRDYRVLIAVAALGLILHKLING